MKKTFTSPASSQSVNFTDSLLEGPARVEDKQSQKTQE